MKKIYAIILAFIFSHLLSAQFTPPRDLSFGVNGFAYSDSAFFGTNFRSILLSSSQKLIAAGHYTNGIGNPTVDVLCARFNADGTIDSSFGNNGYTTRVDSGYTNFIFDAALNSSEEIFITGYVYQPPSDMRGLVVKLTSNGQLDSTFSGDGYLQFSLPGYQIQFSSIIIQADGKILAAGNGHNGTANFLVCRFNMDGSLDNSFNGSGYRLGGISTYVEVLDIVITPDNQILTAGLSCSGPIEQGFVCKLHSNGSVDNAFGVGGISIFLPNSSPPYGIKISSLLANSDGTIYFGGTKRDTTFLGKLLSNGILDPSFNNSSIVFVHHDALLRSICKTNSGDVLMLATFEGVGGFKPNIKKVNQNGQVDQFFNGGSILDEGLTSEFFPNDILVESDDQIVVSGTSWDMPNNGSVLTRYYMPIMSINELVKTNIKVYPNPFDDIINLDLPKNQEIRYSIYNVSGWLICDGNISEDTKIDLSQVNNGIYIMMIQDGKSCSTFKLIKN